MRLQVFMILALGLFLGLGYLSWQVLNSKRAVKSRNPMKKRQSDRKKLNRAEQEAYHNAQRMYQQGNFRGSSKLLESLGFMREAIDVLEHGGLIREAAEVLIRARNFSRAGTVLARHRYWEEALDCFKNAKMPFEAGKCAREMGDTVTAIPYFLEAGALIEAAEGYVELGKHHEAAKIFLKKKDADRASEQYLSLVDSQVDLERIEFPEDEVEFVTRAILDGNGNSRIADILVAKKRVTRLIIELIKKKDLRLASSVQMRNTADIGPELISFPDFGNEESQILAAFFTNAGAHEYAGIVFERLEEFEKAGEAFEKGELYERAAYCFDRCHNKAKVTEMRILVASGSSKLNRIDQLKKAGSEEDEKPSGNRFSLRDTLTDFRAASRDQEEETNPEATPVPKPTEAYLAASGIKPKNSQAAGPLGSPQLQGPTDGPEWENFFHASFMVDLTSQEQELLRRISKTREYSEGAVVLNFNDEPLGIYFVLSGRIDVFKPDRQGHEHWADEMQPPDTFGELWLLMDKPTRVKFVAKSDLRLAWIKRADFELLLDQNGAMARKLFRRFSMTLLSKLLLDEGTQVKKSAS